MSIDPGARGCRIFLSYARGDQHYVEGLADKLGRVGNRAFFDKELRGGQDWWRALMHEIETCDVFAPILTNSYLDSHPCRLEGRYAEDLNKPFLPIQIAEVDPRLLPPAVGNVQWSCYQPDDFNSFLDLVGAITRLDDVPPLPDPLPEMPEVPVSYMTNLSDQISSPSDLPGNEQANILIELKQHLKTEDLSSAIELLRRFRVRPDLLNRVANEIDELLNAAPDPIRSEVFPETEDIVPDPWEAFADSHERGDLVYGHVANRSISTIAIQLAEDVTGFVRESDEGTYLERNGKYVFKIINIDLHDRSIQLCMERTVGDATDRWDAFADTHEVGERHYGRVLETREYYEQIFVQLAEEVEGEVSKSLQDDFNRRSEMSGGLGLQEGMKYVFQIESINLLARRISLSVERMVGP